MHNQTFMYDMGCWIIYSQAYITGKFILFSDLINLYYQIKLSLHLHMILIQIVMSEWFELNTLTICRSINEVLSYKVNLAKTVDMLSYIYMKDGQCRNKLSIDIDDWWFQTRFSHDIHIERKSLCFRKYYIKLQLRTTYTCR